MLLFITALLQQNDLMIGRQIIKHVYYLLLTEEDCIFIGLLFENFVEMSMILFQSRSVILQLCFWRSGLEEDDPEEDTF